jgi:hypothetical protein
METVLLVNDVVVVIGVLSLLGCAQPKASETDTVNSRTAAASSTSSAQVPEVVKAPNDSAGWVVTEHGIGGLRAGMTVKEARAAVPGFKTAEGADSVGCDYASIPGLPPGMSVMVEDGVVGRVDVLKGTVPTSAGARIGDTEATIKKLYAGRVTVSPHKYTDGHYLTVVPKSQVDSAFRIIFETDGTRVLQYRAGRRPQVEYVEGCA